MTDVVVFGSPVSIGHVRPLMPLARRLVERGLSVIWVISGDANEPASVWARPLTELGVQFIDLDRLAMFERVVSDVTHGAIAMRRRVIARANDVSAAATEAIRAAAAGRRIVAGVLDFFALWSYIAMKRLGVPRISVLVSAFPTLDYAGIDDVADDPVYQRELATLRASTSDVASLDPLRLGFMPVDPAVKMFAATSSHLCPDVYPDVHLLGVQRETLPAGNHTAVPAEHEALIRRLRAARSKGARVVLLSMGSVVLRFGARIDPAFPARARQLYTTLAAAALRSGAIVIASTTGSSPDALGLDEATLGSAAHDRVIAMPFVPQPLLFAHGLVDAMLMHGGANTFHETVLAGIPTIVWPVMSDQGSVAHAAMAAGVGACVETGSFPNLAGARSLEHIAEVTLPAMLAPGDNPWKVAASRLAKLLASEDGVTASVAFVLGDR